MMSDWTAESMSLAGWLRARTALTKLRWWLLSWRRWISPGPMTDWRSDFGSASIEGGLVSAVTGNTPDLTYRPLSWFRRGFEFYDTDTQTILDGVVFRGFHEEAAAGSFRDDDNCFFKPCFILFWFVGGGLLLLFYSLLE